MKPVTAQLTALLASRQYRLAKLFTFSLADGVTVLRYCSGDQDITSGGNLYSCGGETGPYFEKEGSKVKGHWKIGLGSDTMTVDVLPGSASILGIPFITAVRIGLFDGADLQIDYAFMGIYGVVDSGCQLVIFKGRVAEVGADRNIISFQINDYRELLNQSLPRELFAASCANTLYDASCTVVQATFTDTVVIALAGSTQIAILANIPHATGYFDMGKLTFTSGQMNGFTVGVSRWVAGTPGTITPTAPLPFAPTAGDTFDISAGCDRTNGAGGCLKFSNIANFRGFPYVPAPETPL